MRTAVVLFNLGGPDRLESVQPFLFNLFTDPAIIRLPWPLRSLVAWLISSRRAPIARKIYAHLGGGSPLLANTTAQAAALERDLGADFKIFLAMRYWDPRAAAAAAAVKGWAPERIVLAPLYPQFSTTTTASSLGEWRREARKIGLNVPTRAICCYPEEPGWVEALAERVREGLARFGPSGPLPRVLFSAHGLPKRVVAAGDPYQQQVERTVAAVMERLAIPGLEHRICYQSRVGPLEWIGPSTDAEIRRAGSDGVALVVVPVAFVSEHSETLVELDIEYRRIADEAGVPAYVRVDTVGVLAPFIEGLARLIRQAAEADRPVMPAEPDRVCPASARGCPLAASAA